MTGCDEADWDYTVHTWFMSKARLVRWTLPPSKNCCVRQSGHEPSMDRLCCVHCTHNTCPQICWTGCSVVCRQSGHRNTVGPGRYQSISGLMGRSVGVIGGFSSRSDSSQLVFMLQKSGRKIVKRTYRPTTTMRRRLLCRESERAPAPARPLALYQPNQPPSLATPPVPPPPVPPRIIELSEHAVQARSEHAIQNTPLSLAVSIVPSSLIS